VTCEWFKLPLQLPSSPPDVPAKPAITTFPEIHRSAFSKISSSDMRGAIMSIDYGTGFENDLESRYFQHYLESTARTIAGPFKTSLWEQLIPQAGLLEPYVRNVIIAIGAISSNMLRSGSEIKPHSAYEFALVQYGKALKGIKRATDQGKQDLRTILIACLLVFCFETLQGLQGSACALASSGLTLFYKTRGDDSTIIYNPDEQLEEDLLQALVGLDLHVLLFLDNRPLFKHQAAIDGINKTLAQMPSNFQNLSEARTFWQLIMKRNFHFEAKAQGIGKAGELAEQCTTQSTWQDTSESPSETIVFSRLRNFPKIQAECQTYIKDIHNWSSAASSLFASFPIEEECSTIARNLLQIHANMNIISLTRMFSTSEEHLDSLLPKFQAIVTLSRSIYAFLLSHSSSYQFDLGIIPALYLVASRCCERSVRGEAIELLQSMEYREGVWDSGAVASISEWLRSVDEGERDSGELPEEMKAVLTSVECNLVRRWARLRCAQKEKTEDFRSREGDLVFREQLVEW
jgi:hypothetical protein